jgi:metal-responsive CopG/Arc/MetJ family transcriptional regulator
MRTRKERRTFTLDPELVTYVEEVRKERRAGSVSSALEEILRESKRQREGKQLEEQIAGYYSSMSEADVEHDREWGEFAETQFPTE